MKPGIVMGRAALLPCRVRGPKGEKDIEMTADTGFTGFLTLPASIIEELGLAFLGLRITELANAQIVSLDRFEAEAFWFERWIRIEVLASEVSPLGGMSLFYGCNFNMDVIGGGRVIITPLE